MGAFKLTHLIWKQFWIKIFNGNPNIFLPQLCYWSTDCVTTGFMTWLLKIEDCTNHNLDMPSTIHVMEMMNKGNHSEAAQNRRQDCSRLWNDELYRRRILNQANEFWDYLGHISLQLLVSESLKLLIAA